MGGYIDIRKLSLEELIGVVDLYPWFGGARKELCLRMSRLGDEAWGMSQYVEAAMYLPSRKLLSDMVRAVEKQDCTDAEDVIKSYIAAGSVEAKEEALPKRKVYAGVGDYFSQEQYDQVRSSEDNVFSRYAAKARQNRGDITVESTEFDFFTETLAQIYAEQGYYEQAKYIYSKLILAYPEKNAYFATLIQKLDELN